MRSKHHFHILAASVMLLFLPLVILQVNGFQSNISGNIKNVRGANKYPHTAVTAIPNMNRITISNPAGFATRDTVLVIQMQGVEIYTVSSVYGEYAWQLGQPGLWEFLIVLSVTGNDISFTSNLKNSYDTRGNMQLIKVPYFNSVKVTGTLVCDPWDPVTKSGGVLPLIVGSTLTLQSNIDVSGSGFRGGAADMGDGICQSVAGSAFTSPAAFTNAGYKGEGIANYNENEIPLLPGNEKGKGKNFTGGGGGNGAYSGGGGGSHRGTGGTGGYERTICIPVSPGGIGGKIVQNAGLGDRIFMGGGGGASTRSASGTSGPGGNGGGIVIIIADKISGSGGNILAKGGDGGSGGGSGPSGAGGGGGGGTIALSVQNYTGTFEANVSGGKGGDNTGRSYGEGGGGGAGLVWLNNDNTLNIIPKLDGGMAGISDHVKAFDGVAGEKQIGFNPELNLFLFNSIRSSVSDNRIDSIISGTVPPKITGTVPVGGTAPYSYAWEKSYDENFTNPVSLLGSSIDFIPTDSETSTVWFRRKVRDSGLPFNIIDQSFPVKFSMRILTSSEKIVARKTLSVYPNPAQKEVTIEFRQNVNGSINLDVTSVSGIKVMRIGSIKTDEVFRYSFPVSDFAPGIYFVQVSVNGIPSGFTRFLKTGE